MIDNKRIIKDGAVCLSCGGSDGVLVAVGSSAVHNDVRDCMPVLKVKKIKYNMKPWSLTDD